MEEKIENFLKELSYDSLQLRDIDDYEIDFIFEKAKEEKFNQLEMLLLARTIADKRRISNNETGERSSRKPKKVLYIPENKIFNSISELARYLSIKKYIIQSALKKNTEGKFKII